jgi:hypothetical protein
MDHATKSNEEKRMAAALPETETARFHNELSHMVRKNIADEGEIRGIVARTKRLLNNRKVDAVEGWMVLALAEFIRGDREQCTKNAALALGTSQQNASVYQNAMMYFAHFGMAQDARKLAGDVLNLFPDNKSALSTALTFTSLYKNIRLADAIMTRLDQLSVNDSHDNHMARIRKDILLSVPAITKSGLSEDDISNRIESAVAALREYGKEVRRINVRTLQDGTFMIFLYVEAAIEESSELNFTIADRLCLDFEDTGVDLFTVVCRPLKHFETMRNKQ